MNFWNPNIAYAVGLLITDGNISKDKRHIWLTSTDKQLLHTFRRCLKIKNRICINPPGSYSRNVRYRISFCNIKFYNWLLKIGLKPNKTFSLSFLNIPERYFFDFLRGHLDGDGSVIHYIDKHNKYKGKTYVYDRLWITFRSASFKHIKWLRQSIRKKLNMNGSLSGWKDKRSNTKKVLWCLKYYKNDSLILLKYLYYKSNVPCFLRKKKIAENYLRKLSKAVDRKAATLFSQR